MRCGINTGYLLKQKIYFKHGSHLIGIAKITLKQYCKTQYQHIIDTLKVDLS